MSYEALDVDTSGLDRLAIVGENGSGKSTIFDSTFFALYGKTRYATLQSAVHDGGDAKTGSVELEFEAGGNTWKIRRTVKAKGGAQSAMMWVRDGQEWREVANKVKSVDDAVVEATGISQDIFEQTIYIRQGEGTAFATMSSKERKAILAGLCNLEHYDEMAQAARDKASEVAASLERSEWERDGLTVRREGMSPGDAELADHSDEALTNKATELEARVDALRDEAIAVRNAAKQTDGTAQLQLDAFDAEVQRKQSEYDHAVSMCDAEVTSARAEVVRAKERLASAEAAEDAAEAKHGEAQKVARDISSKEAELAAAREAVTAALAESGVSTEPAKEAMEAARAAVDDLAKQIHTLDANGKQLAGERSGVLAEREKGGGKCSRCHQPLTAQALDATLAGYDDTLGQLRAQRETYRAEHEAAQAALNDASAQYDAVVEEANRRQQAAAAANGEANGIANTITALKSHKASLEQEAASLEHAASQADALDDALAAAEASLTSKVQAREALVEPVVDQGTRAKLVAAVEATLVSLQEAQGKAEAKVAELKAEAEKLKAQIQRLNEEVSLRQRNAVELGKIADAEKKITAQIAALNKEHQTHKVLAEAMGPKGIPLMVMTEALELANSVAGDICAQLSDKGLSVRLDTVRHTKKGEARPDVVVVPMTPEGDTTFAALSGAEQWRVALALRMALKAIVESRTGAVLDTLIMDEGWGQLDEESRAATIDAVHKLSEGVRFWTVTHIPDVADQFPQQIQVTKTGRASEVSMVS